MAAVTHSQIGEIVVQHHESLPRWGREARWYAGWPWFAVFIVAPGLGAAWAFSLETTPQTADAPSSGLLAGVGVLTGLLFQVLASVAGRISNIADTMDGKPATGTQIRLLQRLDIARANIAYACMVSIVTVTWLGVLALVEVKARWPVALSAFLLLHLAATLMLVLLRINRIGRDDRVAALTSHAEAKSGR